MVGTEQSPERGRVDHAKTAARLADEIQGIWDAAERANRGLTADERQYMEGLVDEAKSQHELEKKMREIGGGGVSFVTATDPNHSHTGGGPGDVFVKSAAYKKIADPAGRSQQWSTGPVEVSSSHVLIKGTMLETTVGGPGGGLVPPQYEPGVVSKLFEPLGVRDVFGQSTTTASQVRYVVEGTALSGAAGVGEAGTKPESTINMAEIVEPIKKIATTLPISDEMLEDAPSIQSYLNGRLTLFVSIEEERQLLRGTGTNELIGLFNRTGRPGDQPVHEARRGRQRNVAGAGAGEHRGVVVPPARRHPHAPDELSLHATAEGRARRHGRQFPRWRAFHRGIWHGRCDGHVRADALEHPGRVVHGRRPRDRAGRQLRPGRPHLPPRGRIRGGH